MKWIILPLLALLYRMRGGFWAFAGTTVTRLLYWVVPATGAVWWLGWSYQKAALCGLGAYLGLMISHGKAVGTVFGRSDWAAASVMSSIGVFRWLLMTAPLLASLPNGALYAFWGVTHGLAYYVGNAFLDGKDGFIAKGGAEWGEVLAGFFYGLGLVGLSIVGGVLHGG